MYGLRILYFSGTDVRIIVAAEGVYGLRILCCGGTDVRIIVVAEGMYGLRILCCGGTDLRILIAAAGLFEAGKDLRIMTVSMTRLTQNSNGGRKSDVFYSTIQFQVALDRNV
jgi:hypothetical protein